MPKEPNETPAPQAATPLTVEMFMAGIRELVAANKLDLEMVRELSTQATIDTYDRTTGKNWDEKLYPRVSAFNPAGDKANPRPEIVGEVFWVGSLLQKDELTPNEITLLNQIEPGAYGPEGSWVVRDLHPGRDRSKRKLLVLFPCTDETARAALPQGEWGGGKTGVEQMCEVMLRESLAATV